MNAWQITLKDLRLLARDRRTLSILIILPLTFIAILGSSTGQLFGTQAKNRTVRVGVANEDASDLSYKILGELLKIKGLQITEFPNRTEGRSVLAESKIDVLLIIGPEYARRVNQLELRDLFNIDEGRLRNRLQSLDMSVEAGSFLANAADIVRALVFSFATQTTAPTVMKNTDPVLATRILRQAKRAADENADALEQDVTPADVPPPKSMANIVYQVVVPSYTVLFTFFILHFMARSFISERDLGTLNRLRMAPVTRSGLMVGKTIPFLVISVVQSILLFIFGKILFGMSWGSQPWLLLPVIFGTSLSATSLGLLIAAVVRTDSQVSAYGNFLVLTMAGISGCFMPRDWLSPMMQQVGLVTPHAWALIAYNQVLNAATPDLHEIGRCCAVLLGFSLAFFAVALWRFRDIEPQ